MTFDLLAKFRSVARYGVAVFLPALSCFSEGGTGAINCSTSEPFLQDGVWVVIVNCEGNLFTQQTIPLEHYVPPGGSCTNCTAMSPEECENHKRRILSDLDYLQPRIQEETANIQRQVAELSGMVNYLLSQAHFSTAALRSEGDQFEFFDNMLSIPGSSTLNKVNYIASLPTGPYQDDFINHTLNSASHLYTIVGGNNGIYNYYNDTVKGVTETVDQQIMTARNALDNFQLDTSGLDEISEDMVALRSYVSNEIVCTACQGSSGGGGGDGGGGATEGCPCSEVLTHIKNIVRGMSNDVAVIRQKIEKWDKYFETFKYQMKVITDAVAPIGTNFVFAVQYRDLDGVTFQMKQLDQLLHNQPQKPNEFDFSSFKNYSWFTRVEYLLMSIAGVYSVTNRDDDLTQAVINEAYSDIADTSSTLETKVQSIKSNVTGLHTAFKGLFNALKSSVSTHDGSGTVTLSASWFDGRGLTFTLPSGVTGSLRTITSLLWTIIFVVVMDQFLLYAWISFSYVYRFCVRQMTDFVK